MQLKTLLEKGSIYKIEPKRSIASQGLESILTYTNYTNGYFPIHLPSARLLMTHQVSCVVLGARDAEMRKRSSLPHGGWGRKTGHLNTVC